MVSWSISTTLTCQSRTTSTPLVWMSRRTCLTEELEEKLALQEMDPVNDNERQQVEEHDTFISRRRHRGTDRKRANDRSSGLKPTEG